MNLRVSGYLLLAGATDTITGALLLLAPSRTLTLMGLFGPPIAARPDELLRFIGAFVFAVGTITLWPLVRREWLGFVFAATAWVRICVGSYVAIAIYTGRLDVGWVSVAVIDLGLAAIQIAWRRRLEGRYAQ